MNRIFRALILTLLLLGTMRPAAASTPMHVAGTVLKDADGNTVVLRGVDIGSLEYDSATGGDHVAQSVPEALNVWQARIIRLPLNEDFWFGYDYKSTQSPDGGAAYRHFVDQRVALAAQANAYVILDCHWSDEGIWGANQGQHEGPDDHSTLFWQSCAAQYKNNPAVLFELYNEPVNTDWNTWRSGGSITEKGKTYHSPGQQSLLNTIRATGAANPILVDGLAYSSDFSGVVNGYDLSDPLNNFFYDAHIYPCTGQNTKDWDRHVAAVAAIHALIVGEWGAAPNGDAYTCVPQPDAAIWIQNMLGWLNQHQYSWTAYNMGIPASQLSVISDWKYTKTPYFGVPVYNYLTSHSSIVNAGRIDAAGGTVGGFLADTNYSGGSIATNWSEAINTSGVTHPAPQAVYQTERYGTFTYTVIGLPAHGKATVRLHFAENHDTAAGRRLENVSINHRSVLSNFDIYATAKAIHKAVIKQFHVTADGSGKVAISFAPAPGSPDSNALVNGIEVSSASAAATKALPIPHISLHASPINGLHVQGNRFVDMNGHAVFLRGVVICSLEYTPGGEGVLSALDSSLHRWKANFIRLPMNEDYWFGYGANSNSYRALVDQVVHAVTEDNAYVMLDLHWSDQGSWGCCNSQHMMPDDHSTLFWRDVAARYANNPHIIFDMYNEPYNIDFKLWRNGGIVPDGIHYHSPGMQGLLNAIRNVGAHNIVLAGGKDWGSVLTGMREGGYGLTDPDHNLAYGIHLYPMSTTDGYLGGLDRRIDGVDRQYPIIIGEFGTDLDNKRRIGTPRPDPVRWMNNALRWIDRHGYNFTAWAMIPDVVPSLTSNYKWDPNPYAGQPIFNYLNALAAPRQGPRP